MIVTVSLCLFILFHNFDMPFGSAKVEDLGGGIGPLMFSCLATDPTVAIFVIISCLIICGVARWAGHGYNSVSGEHPQSVRFMHLFKGLFFAIIYRYIASIFTQRLLHTT